MRALVIGADGFAGRWLLRHLVASGDEVVAGVGPRFERQLPDQLVPHPIDVRDADAVTRLVQVAVPTVIYYLAGVSQAGRRDDVSAGIGVSVVGAGNVIGGAAKMNGRIRLIHVGSSHMYSSPLDNRPISEDVPVKPRGVYGAVKAAAEAMLLHLGPAVGVDVIAVRAFNHIGPGQDSAFVVPSFAKQVAQITRGEAEPVIRVGNPDVRRDFTDVRDVVRAYRMLAMQGVAGEAYNVASGVTISIAELVNHLKELAGIGAVIEADPSRSRSNEPPEIAGNADKLKRATGWRPTISLRVTLGDVLAELLGRHVDQTLTAPPRHDES